MLYNGCSIWCDESGYYVRSADASVVLAGPLESLEAAKAWIDRRMEYPVFSVQFSNDGVTFWTIIKFDHRELAERVCKSLAGYACEPYGLGSYWRVREADQQSADFHAVSGAGT